MTTPNQRGGADLSPTTPDVDTSAPAAWAFVTANGIVWDFTNLADVAARWALNHGEDKVVALYAAQSAAGVQECERCKEVDTALLAVCRDNTAEALGEPDPTLGRYLLLNENGDELIDTDDPCEVIARISEMWDIACKNWERAESANSQPQTPSAAAVTITEDDEKITMTVGPVAEDEAVAALKRHGWTEQASLFGSFRSLVAPEPAASEGASA